MAKVATVKMHSISAYQQGRPFQITKEDKESYDAFEERTWRERLHTNEDGTVFIPGIQFKKCLETAASFLSIKIPGKGNSLFTKHFLAGVLVLENLQLGINKDTISGLKVFCDSRGVRGGSNPRVWKTFPTITEWEGTVEYYILDDTITKEVFEKVARESGNFIGIGVFRPKNGGCYGRFEIDEISWSE